ncbi:MAG: tRNA lysidine(34) synthetase TilS [Clostridia bacterium]|nr:tRNA lysidine(34) synthetase TilS [Clostridia bacterium]
MNRARISFIRKLSKYFENLPFSVQEKGLCIALSGGADSVALLLGMAEVSETFGFNISACHFNHMIRGDEADRDEEFCKQLCKNHNIKIFCGRDDVPAYASRYNIGIEEAARSCRYAFFERICSKDTVDYCVTAHNMNDDAETLLINLIRGSGSYGASSIAPYKDKILRPLLEISRQEIEEFLSESEQTYVTDSTNLCNDYTRNYVRNVIIPDMCKLNPSVVEALSRYSASCRSDREYFEAVINENLDTDLRLLPKALRNRVLMKKYKEFSGQSLNSNMVSDIDRALFSEKRVCVPLFDHTEAVINNGNVQFFNKSENPLLEYDFQELQNGTNKVFGDRVIIDISNNKSSGNFNNLSTNAYISEDKIIGKLKVRNRRVGDKIFIKGMNKTLKKLFIDKKVPKEYRNIIPIIFDEEGIIYVPFVGVADRVIQKENNDTIYITTIFNTIEKERWTNAYEK